MAASLAQKMLGTKFRILASGNGPTSEVHPIAAEVMQEIDVDINNQVSIFVHNAVFAGIDMVITLSASDDLNHLPPEVQHFHWPIPDPEAGRRTYGEKKQRFREVRELIQLRLRIFVKELE